MPAGTKRHRSWFYVRFILLGGRSRPPSENILREQPPEPIRTASTALSISLSPARKSTENTSIISPDSQRRLRRSFSVIAYFRYLWRWNGLTPLPAARLLRGFRGHRFSLPAATIWSRVSPFCVRVPP